MEKRIIICQWNCRSAISNKDNLERLLLEKNVDIALLNETWFKPGKYISFAGYNIERKDRQDGQGGGVAILVKTNIPYKYLNYPPINNISYLGIEVPLVNGKWVSLISLYIKPQIHILTNTWDQFFTNIKKPFIIGGDFNAHHLAWGCAVNNTAGKSLIDSLENNQIIFLNDGSPTYIGRYENQNSAIDLTLSSQCLQHRLDWSVLWDTYGSDHVPIIVECQLDCNKLNFDNSKKWNTKQADWDLFYIECLKNMDIFSKNNYSDFINALNLSLEKSVPKYNKKSSKKSKGKSWWNDSCDRAVLLRKDKFSEYKHNPNLDNLLSYKKADAEAKKIIKQSKREAWRNYCSSLNKNIPSKSIWTKLNNFKNRKQQNTHYVDINSDWITEFHTQLSPPFVVDKFNQENNNLNNENSSLVLPFSNNELSRVLKQNNSSAPGKDCIQYSMLYHMPDSVKKKLLDIFNMIFHNTHEIPSDWTEYLVVPILKPGKQHNSATSYRPIALASCILKTYERIIKNRLEHWLEKHMKLPSTQYAFRKKCNTQEVLAYLVTDIQLNFSENKSTSTLFLDIQGAYDNVNLVILWTKMRQLNIPEQLIYNISMIYSCRKLHVKAFNGITSFRYTGQGLAQGSILSPLLYIIYTYDLERMFNNNTKILQFADDVCIYNSDKDIDTCNRRLNDKLAETIEWFNQNSLTISPGKSVLCTFTRKRFLPPNTINLNNMDIPYRTSVKYLGIILDKKLLWKEEINKIIKRSENGLNILRAFCHQKWGSDPNICLTFYRSLIRSIFDYGSFLYGSAAETHLKKLESIKNKCLRLSIGYLRSTPINAMEMETLEPPLDLRRNFISDKYLIKLLAKCSPLVKKINDLTVIVLTNKYWTHKKTPNLVQSYMWLNELKEDIYQSQVLPCFSIEYEEYNINIDVLISNNINFKSTEEIKKIFLEDLNTKWQGHNHIFTDGSLINNKTGCAYLHANTNVSKKIKLPTNTSIYTAELVAIREALIYCLEYEATEPGNKYVIFSDCKSALENIKSSALLKNTNHIVCEIVHLNKLLKDSGKLVYLVWVKAHIGINANEKVDKLAKQATEDGHAQTIKLPYTDLFPVVKNKFYTDWHLQQKISHTGKYYMSLQSERSKRQTWFHSMYNRNFIRVICRLRTLHVLVPSYLYKIGKKININCECGEVGDAQHCILNCDMYQQQNAELFVKLRDFGVLPTNLSNLLALENIDIYKLLYKHINEMNLKL